MSADTSTAVHTEIVVEVPIEREGPTRIKASEVAVTFTAEAPDRTKVELEHRHLDRHGEGWEGMRDAVGAGWSNLDGYGEAAEGRPPFPA